jgi:anti-sigma factor RsiW
MNHKAFQQKLSAYVDHELAEEQTELMRKHIEGCAACRRQLQELHSIRTQIRAAATVTLPDNFIYSVKGAIRREQSESVVWLGTERLARNVVVGLCILVLGMVVFESYLTPQQSFGVDRYFNGEPADSAAQTIIGSQQELSKADILMAVMTR